MGAPIPNFIEFQERMTQMELARLLQLLSNFRIITMKYTVKASQDITHYKQLTDVAKLPVARIVHNLDSAEILLNNSPLIQFAMQLHIIVKQNPVVHFRLHELDYQNVSDLKKRVCIHEPNDFSID